MFRRPAVRIPDCDVWNGSCQNNLSNSSVVCLAAMCGSTGLVVSAWIHADCMYHITTDAVTLLVCCHKHRLIYWLHSWMCHWPIT